MENLPTGFRFYPTEEELVAFYLQNQLEGQKKHINKVIPVVGIYDVEPSQLPELAGEMCRGDTEQWFFFSPRQEREAMGGRPNRTTARGYWKATGSPGYVYSSDNTVIGIKKNMVFYEGKAPCGRKTRWKMNEYRAIEVSESDQSSVATPKLRHEFSLCRVYVISGSFGAFDRRPLEKLTVKSQKHRWDRAAGACPQQNEVMDGTSSFETSHLGGEHSTDFPDAGGSSSTIWNVYNGVEGPLWEWEQFNMV